MAQVSMSNPTISHQNPILLVTSPCTKRCKLWYLKRNITKTIISSFSHIFLVDWVEHIHLFVKCFFSIKNFTKLYAKMMRSWKEIVGIVTKSSCKDTIGTQLFQSKYTRRNISRNLDTPCLSLHTFNTRSCAWSFPP